MRIELYTLRNYLFNSVTGTFLNKNWESLLELDPH